MKKRHIIPVALLIGALFTFRLFPRLSRLWSECAIIPLNMQLHRLTGRVSFPVFEIFCILAAGFVILSGIRVLCAFIVRRQCCMLIRWFRNTCILLFIPVAGYVFLWYPVYWSQDAVPSSVPTASQLTWLCEELISGLNRSELVFPEQDDIILAAQDISGIPGARIKSARYPEWMHLLHISGLFSPWTGEVIISPDTPISALPFTAVHELMHLKGIADEGTANYEAWKVCINADGIFRDSANLWILKYALEILSETKPDSIAPLLSQMDACLYRTFAAMGGRSAPPGRIAGMIPSALGLTRSLSSYSEVVEHILRTDDI